MKFSATIIAAVAATTVTDVSAFGVNSGFAIRQSTFSSPSSLYALADLESKLLSDGPAPKATKPKREKVVREPRAKKSKAKAAPAPEPVPEPEPVVVEEKPAKKGRKSKVKTSQYVDLSDEVPKVKKAAPTLSSPKRLTPKPVKPVKPKKEKAPKAAAAPRSTADADPNAKTVGVALGAAPLVLAPFIALSAARGALSSTVARREEIQQEIAAKEAAAAKIERQSDVDGGGVAVALVSYIIVGERFERMKGWVWRVQHFG